MVTIDFSNNMDDKNQKKVLNVSRFQEEEHNFKKFNGVVLPKENQNYSSQLIQSFSIYTGIEQSDLEKHSAWVGLLVSPGKNP